MASRSLCASSWARRDLIAAPESTRREFFFKRKFCRHCSWWQRQQLVFPSYQRSFSSLSPIFLSHLFPFSSLSLAPLSFLLSLPQQRHTFPSQQLRPALGAGKCGRAGRAASSARAPEGAHQGQRARNPACRCHLRRPEAAPGRHRRRRRRCCCCCLSSWFFCSCCRSCCSCCCSCCCCCRRDPRGISKGKVTFPLPPRGGRKHQ